MRFLHGVAICLLFFSALYLIDFGGVLILGIFLHRPEIGHIILGEMSVQRVIYYGVIRGVEIMIGWRLIQKKRHEVYDFICQKKFVVYMLALSLFLAMSQLLMVRAEGATIELFQKKSLWVVLVIATIVIVFLYQMDLALRKQSVERKMETKMMTELFLQSVKDQDSYTKAMHDIKYRAYAMQQLLEEAKYEEAKKQMARIMGEITKGDFEIWCEDSVVNAILNKKVNAAKTEGIQVDTDVNVFACPIDQVDFCVIISNLMDNAIEASVQAVRPWIELHIRTQGSRLLLRVRNSFRYKPMEKEGKLLTRKANPEQHGFGLQNVKETIERNNGQLQIAYESEIFEVNVRL